MVLRDPSTDGGDHLGEVIELAMAALKRQELAIQEQPGVTATLAIARMQRLAQSNRLGRCAQPGRGIGEAAA